MTGINWLKEHWGRLAHLAQFSRGAFTVSHIQIKQRQKVPAGIFSTISFVSSTICPNLETYTATTKTNSQTTSYNLTLVCAGNHVKKGSAGSRRRWESLTLCKKWDKNLLVLSLATNTVTGRRWRLLPPSDIREQQGFSWRLHVPA